MSSLGPVTPQRAATFMETMNELPSLVHVLGLMVMFQILWIQLAFHFQGLCLARDTSLSETQKPASK